MFLVKLLGWNEGVGSLDKRISIKLTKCTRLIFKDSIEFSSAAFLSFLLKNERYFQWYSYSQS